MKKNFKKLPPPELGMDIELHITLEKTSFHCLGRKRCRRWSLRIRGSIVEIARLICSLEKNRRWQSIGEGVRGWSEMIQSWSKLERGLDRVNRRLGGEARNHVYGFSRAEPLSRVYIWKSKYVKNVCYVTLSNNVT